MDSLRNGEVPKNPQRITSFLPYSLGQRERMPSKLPLNNNKKSNVAFSPSTKDSRQLRTQSLTKKINTITSFLATREQKIIKRETTELKRSNTSTAKFSPFFAPREAQIKQEEPTEKVTTFVHSKSPNEEIILNINTKQVQPKEIEKSIFNTEIVKPDQPESILITSPVEEAIDVEENQTTLFSEQNLLHETETVLDKVAENEVYREIEPIEIEKSITVETEIIDQVFNNLSSSQPQELVSKIDISPLVPTFDDVPQPTLNRVEDSSGKPTIVVEDYGTPSNDLKRIIIIGAMFLLKEPTVEGAKQTDTPKPNPPMTEPKITTVIVGKSIVKTRLGSGLLLRKESNENAPTIISIPNGDTVGIIKYANYYDVVDGENGRWVYVQYKDKEGWCWGVFLVKIE